MKCSEYAIKRRISLLSSIFGPVIMILGVAQSILLIDSDQPYAVGVRALVRTTKNFPCRLNSIRVFILHFQTKFRRIWFENAVWKLVWNSSPQLHHLASKLSLDAIVSCDKNRHWIVLDRRRGRNYYSLLVVYLTLLLQNRLLTFSSSSRSTTCWSVLLRLPSRYCIRVVFLPFLLSSTACSLFNVFWTFAWVTLGLLLNPQAVVAYFVGFVVIFGVAGAKILALLQLMKAVEKGLHKELMKLCISNHSLLFT